MTDTLYDQSFPPLHRQIAPPPPLCYMAAATTDKVVPTAYLSLDGPSDTQKGTSLCLVRLDVCAQGSQIFRVTRSTVVGS
jgi:hypothetical protein